MADDLILAREAPVGNVAIVPPGLEVCLGQRTVLIRPDTTKVNPHYLLYLLLGDEVQGRIHSTTSGATVPHLNLAEIRKFPLGSLPPRSTQDRIAAALAAYDDLIENNTRRIKLLEEMSRALYREWFVEYRFPGHEMARTDAVGRLPVGWRTVALGDVTRLVRDGVDPSSIAGETPYFGLEHLPRRSITLTEWGSAAEVESTKIAARPGDIAFGKIRPYFHKVGVIPVDCVCSSDTILWRAHEGFFALVLFAVSSDEFVAHATKTSQGTKMPRANGDVLSRWPIPVPPDALRKRFETLVGDMVAQLRTLALRNRSLRATRDLLLPKLISGEIDVSDLRLPTAA